MTVRTHILIGALGAMLGLSVAASPLVVRVDGAMFDEFGVPVTGARDIQIRAYDDAQAGTLLWTSNVYTATLNEGRFSVPMDGSTGSPSLAYYLSTYASSAAVYFEITYDAGAANGVMDSPVLMPMRIRAKGTIFSLVSGSSAQLKKIPISTSTPVSGQLLGYDGTQWAPMGVTVLVNNAYALKSGDNLSGNLLVPGVQVTGLSPNSLVFLDGSKNLVSLGSLSDLTLLAGVSANIQSQLNAKLSTGSVVSKSGDTMTGGLQTTMLNLSSSSAGFSLSSDASKNLTTSSVSATELGYLSGASSGLQAQISAKQSNFASQSANFMYAGPSSGGATTPTFRALVQNDLPLMVGDSGSGGVKGAAPAPSAGAAAANKFLKADGTWANFNYLGQTCSAGYYMSGFDSTGTKICTALPSNVTFTRVSAGNQFECGLLSDTTVKCWGLNGSGQLGNGSTTGSYVPVDVRGPDGSKLSSITDIAAGYSSVCALKNDGTVWCWGYNGYGNTGNGNTTNPQLSPTQVINLTSATQISAGYHSTCARRSNGTIKCWGYNGYGELGDNTTVAQSTPVQVITVSNANQVSMGMSSACAALSDGTAKCWGYNGMGEMGDGTTTNRPTPVNVIAVGGGSAMTGVTYIAAARGNNSYAEHACAVKTDGSMACWGINNYGQLGSANTTTSYTPVSVVGMANAVKVQTGLYFTCATISDGTAKCWGYNGVGNLGTNNTSTYYAPVNVLNSTGSGNLSSVTDIALHDGAAGGNFHATAVANGKILSWGDNGGGQYGNNSTTASSLPKGAFGP
ncbi:MAG: hypothetical protein JST16_03430 [Bdellovibrionales bacterium]|nr:hypothetical protein [Bdellovibrionales bacterium]